MAISIIMADQIGFMNPLSQYEYSSGSLSDLSVLENDDALIQAIRSVDTERLQEFKVEVEGENVPFLIHLANENRLEVLLEAVKRYQQEKLSLHVKDSCGNNLLHILFDTQDSNDPNRLELLTLLIEEELSLRERNFDDNKPLIYALQQQWDAHLVLRERVCHYIKLHNETFPIMVGVQPLLNYLCEHPETYSEEMIEYLVNEEVADYIVVLSPALLYSSAALPTKESEQVSLSTEPPLQTHLSQKLQKHLSQDWELVHSFPKSPQLLRRAKHKIDDFVHNTKVFFEKEFYKVSAKYRHQRRPSELLELIPNQGAIAVNTQRRASEKDEALLPVKFIENHKVKKETLKKILLFRKFIIERKESEKRAVKNKKVIRKQRRELNRTHSLRSQSSSISSSLTSSINEHPDWVRFGSESDLSGFKRFIPPAQRWKDAANRIMKLQKSDAANMWEETLTLVEKQLAKEHKEAALKSELEIKDFAQAVARKFDVDDLRTQLKQEGASLEGDLSGRADNLIVKLESYKADEMLGGAVGKTMDAVALLVTFSQNKEVIASWDISSIESIVNSISGLASMALNTVSGGAGVISHCLPEEVAHWAEGVADVSSIINVIQTSLLDIQHVALEIINLAKQLSKSDRSPSEFSNQDIYCIVTVGADLAKKIFQIVKNLLFVAKQIMDLTDTVSVGLNKAIPGLSILLGIIDIGERSLYLANSAFYFAQFAELKHLEKEYFPQHSELRRILDEESRTKHATLHEIAFERDDLSFEVVNTAQRYFLFYHIKSLCQTRIVHAAYHIVWDVVDVTSGALKLGEVSAGVGIGISVGAAVSKASVSVIQWLSQQFHNRKEEDHLKICRMMAVSMKALVNFLNQDFQIGNVDFNKVLTEDVSSNPELEKLISQYHELSLCFYALGFKIEDFANAKFDDSLLQKIYKTIKRIE